MSKNKLGAKKREKKLSPQRWAKGRAEAGTLYLLLILGILVSFGFILVGGTLPEDTPTIVPHYATPPAANQPSAASSSAVITP